MNILSHYYTDGETNKPYYNLGLVLPDLVGGFHRGWKLKEMAHEDKWYADLQHGCLSHFSADKYFHNIHEFKEAVKFIREVMEKYKLQNLGIRTFFGAHILFELQLDALIVKNHKNVADNFYEAMEVINSENLSLFLMSNNTEAHTEFMEFFPRFVSMKYIYRYAETPGLFYAFKNIMKRGGMNELPTDAEIIFKDISAETEKFVSDIFYSIFESLKNRPAQR